MPIIGTFAPIKDGYAGHLRTLSLNGRVRILAHDHKTSDGAPDFQVLLGNAEVGATWRKVKQGSEESHLRVRLDDPTWPQPIWCVLLESSEDGVIRLIWRRSQSARETKARGEDEKSRV